MLILTVFKLLAKVLIRFLCWFSRVSKLFLDSNGFQLMSQLVVTVFYEFVLKLPNQDFFAKMA